MSIRYVSITGADLDYFKNLVRQGLSGDLGDLTEVRLTVTDVSVHLSANGFDSNKFGTVDAIADDGPVRERMYPAENNETSREPELLGDIMRRMFPNVSWSLNVHNQS